MCFCVLALLFSRVIPQFENHSEKNNRKGQSALWMAAVQTIMESREKAGPSERPNMQSANVFKGFTNRASGGANVYWAQGEGIGRPHVWMCQPGNAPPSQKCLCVLLWQLPVCWRKLMSLWMCFWGEGRQMGWWRESGNGRDIFVPQEMKQAVHTL